MLIGNSVKRQAGLSLVELMVGLAIGLMIVGGATSVYVGAVRSGSDTLRSAKLNIELQGAMNMMVAEIRRAGYSNVTTSLSNNPFTQTGTNMAIPSASCILFSYDRNGNGTVDSSDYMGFKMNGSAISMRYSGASTSAGCSVAGDSWESITDANSIVVDSLVFSVSAQCVDAQTGAASASQACVTGQSVYDTATSAVDKSDLIEIRDVSISIAGHHKDDSTTHMTLTQSIKVRNDRIETVGL